MHWVPIFIGNNNSTCFGQSFSPSSGASQPYNGTSTVYAAHWPSATRIRTFRPDPESFLECELFLRKVVEKIKLAFSENHAVYEIMWNSVVEPGRLQMTVTKTTIQTHKFINYVFSTTKVVTWMSQTITLYAQPLSGYDVRTSFKTIHLVLYWVFLL
jgi:hypothetical protein